MISETGLARQVRPYAQRSCGQGRIRINYTTGAVRASQYIAYCRNGKDTFPNDKYSTVRDNG